LTAVMANEVWGEMYDRLAELIRAHCTTLIFVNQRRIAERCSRHLAEEHVTAHHGSLTRERRLNAEQRLKGGVPIAVQSGGDVHYLTPRDACGQWEVRNLLIRKQRPGSYVELPAERQ